MKVDAVAVSDDSTARSGNIYRILGQYSPELLLTDTDLFRKNTTKSVDILPFGENVRIHSPAIKLETFTDIQGGNWQRLTCGEAVALICPEKGNCALLPEEWRSCDTAVVGKELNGVSVLHVGAIIITAKEKNADLLRNRLQSMGFRHVYTTSQYGNITISVRNGSLRIQTDDG